MKVKNLLKMYFSYRKYKKKVIWLFRAILRVFSLNFPKPLERALYVTTTEIPLDTVCLNKAEICVGES